VSDAADLPFTFLRDLFDDADPWVEPDETDAAAEPYVASRAAMLDATANVLAAMRELLQATEEMVRLRRDRLVDGDAGPAAPPSGTTANGHRREHIVFTDEGTGP
jgi:hypothetical protein